VCYLPLGLPPCAPGVTLPFASVCRFGRAANLDFWNNGAGPLGRRGLAMPT
jgi:hypothetical protein